MKRSLRNVLRQYSLKRQLILGLFCKMPARPSYFAKLPAGIEALRALQTDWIDRRQLEEALSISKTVAWRLLRLCGVEPGPGGALVSRREGLISQLEQLVRDGGAVELEIRRRGRLEELLGRIRPAVVANLTRVVRNQEQALDLINTRFTKLPGNVALTPRSLHIDFSGTEDFLKAIGAVIYALNNDFEAISEFVEAGGSIKPVRPKLPI
jgi:hypothetical protein